MIRFSPGVISRADLARQMDLTRTAISTIVDNKAQYGLVHETEDGPTTGGRRPFCWRSTRVVMWSGLTWGHCTWGWW
jgi:predicted transcriptional regulator